MRIKMFRITLTDGRALRANGEISSRGLMPRKIGWVWPESSHSAWPSS
jgi:hypothetical protein